MQATRIIEARDHIAHAAYAAMRRVEADAALCRLSRTVRANSAPSSLRPRLRTSRHLYNTEEDVEKVLAVLRP